MHARLLLPAVFAVVLPVSVVAADRARLMVVGAVAAWAVLCATTLRPSHTATVGPHLIGDERGAWTRDVAGTPNPVRLRDFLQNLGVALRTSGTRVPADPTTAAHAFCPPRR